MATRIWLCDLTYTQQTISSDVMPAAVGGIATYIEKILGNCVETRIFKFPEELCTAFEEGPPPHIIGFSNYIWNRDLSTQFAKVIKRKLPHIVTVMGGPNYPTTELEQEAFLRAHPMIDFYVVKEGEKAFVGLAESLIDNNFEIQLVRDDLPSIHRIDAAGNFRTSLSIERILDLSEIPSPYLTGKLDRYFDGAMLPIIQTNRGCPFRCTFCVEGMPYYSRVAKGNAGKVTAELEYIASRMAYLRDTKDGRSDFHIADSNFGMYKEDLDICHAIAKVQSKYGYPEYINVATGKNHKERVLEASKIIGGALRLSGSVQSLNPVVLKNINRENVNAKKLLEMALDASEIGANSYSEIILALPGDSKKIHFDTIREIVEADFNNIALYQLMLLPGTNLASEESVKKWRMETRYRVLPRCFGYFDVLGEHVNAAEIERIVVSSESLTLDDYLDCRRMHLIINLFYNDGIFKELLRLLKLLGVSIFDWLEKIWHYRNNGEFDDLITTFLEETESELWETEEDLRSFVRDRSNIERYIAADLGANLIFKYRSRAVIADPACIASVALETIDALFDERNVPPQARQLAAEIIEFSRLRMTNIFDNMDAVHRAMFSFDLNRFADDILPDDIDSYRYADPVEYRFALTRHTKQTIRSFLGTYGDSLMGLSRILSKVYFRKLLRNVEHEGKQSVHLNEREKTLGQGQLSGLNEFA